MPQIHDAEADTSEPVVRSLLRAQCPQWAGRALRPVGDTGTDHVMWRLGDDLVMRVPRTPGAAASLSREVRALAAVAPHVPVAVPQVAHVGAPDPSYPHVWAVLHWLPGADAWEARDALEHDDVGLAHDLADVIGDLRVAPPLPLPSRGPGERGGPLEGVLQRAHAWLDGEEGPLPPWVDAPAVRAALAASQEVAQQTPDDAPYVLTHGDLIPGNILVRQGRLAAVIDWGYVSLADPALDLVCAWAVLGPTGRTVLRERVGADDATWERARINALEQALGGLAYYTPRAHPLADVMGRTLGRVLSDARSR